jgi:hypothetical protein
MTAKVHCYNIRWSVEDEDVIDSMPEEDIEDEEKIEARIAEVKASLGTEMDLVLEIDEPSDLTADYICDELTEAGNWLVEGFNYKVLTKFPTKKRKGKKHA